MEYLKILEVIIGCLTVWLIVLIAILTHQVIMQYIIEKSTNLQSNRDKWFEPGGHLYEKEQQ